ncbi:hypothetical protein H0H92_007825 [Tricholoma furcatifolium]|nr:hypothetical protein H0H92_007825 [Tricholoma furcatifolium]
MYEGRIIRRMDSDDSKVEVQITVKLMVAKVPNIVVPLAHLCDLNDPKNRPLLQVYNPSEVAQAEPEPPMLQLPPDNPLPPPLPIAASSTPAWTPSAGTSSAGTSSTPAWDPSSRTPDPRGPQPDSFPKNPYIASTLLSDDLCIDVIIYNTTQAPRWEGGKWEGSRAIWRKGDNKEPGMARVSISGRVFSLPERYIRPNHPTKKGPVIVVDPLHEKYCGEFVIVQMRKDNQCIARPKGTKNSRSRHDTRFPFPTTALATVVGCEDW